MTMVRVEITVPGNPWSKKRPRISKPVAGRPPRTHQSPDDKAAEDRTRGILLASMVEQGADTFTGNVAVRVSFFRATRQVVDLDNLEKHILDAGNGILWKDDSQITVKTSSLDLDRDNPRTTIIVVPDATTTMKRGTDHVDG